MRTRSCLRVLLASFAAFLAVSYILPVPLAAAPPRDRAAGRLDKSFGTAGLVKESWPPLQAAHARDVVARPDGSILLAGGDMNGARITRYDAGGNLDATFGNGGSVTFGPEGIGVEGSVVAMALRPDGKIVVAGERTGPNQWSWYRYVARLHPDGSLDTGFGISGFAVLGNGGPNESLADLALQPDGKIVVGGRSAITFEWKFYLARLNEDGLPDTSFGAAGGALYTSFPGSVRAWVTSVLIQPDGRIVAVGDATNDVGISRYEPDGTLDASFAVGGLLVSDMLVPHWAGLQPDGSIVVAGSWRDITMSYPDMAVARFLPDGALDTAFGVNGRTTIDFNDNYDAAAAGAIQNDGRIVIGGTAYIFKAGQANIAFGLTRLEPDGSLDKGFGRGGTSYVSLGEPELEAIALQPNGGILAAGTAVEQSSGSIWFTWFLARFNP